MRLARCGGNAWGGSAQSKYLWAVRRARRRRPHRPCGENKSENLPPYSQDDAARLLNVSDRSIRFAAKLANMPVGRPWPSVIPSIDGFTQEQAAKLLNVAVKSVERAAAVRAKADDPGGPFADLATLVERGQLAVSAAASCTKKSEPFVADLVRGIGSGLKPTEALPGLRPGHHIRGPRPSRPHRLALNTHGNQNHALPGLRRKAVPSSCRLRRIDRRGVLRAGGIISTPKTWPTPT